MRKEKITVKDILNDNYNDFKNKYWNKHQYTKQNSK